MARIAGVNIPREKRIEIGLTYVYGIGRPTANKVLEETGISRDTYVRDLTEEEIARLRDVIEKTLGGRGRPPPRALERHEAPDGDRLLPRPAPPARPPVRGQRTKTNARTRKGPKRTVGKQRKS